MRKSLPYILIAVILILAAGAWFLLSNRTNKTDTANKSYMTNGTNKADMAQVDDAAAGAQVYSHPFPLFSFSYPAGYSATRFDEGEGETVLVQKDGKGLQVYISELPEGAVVNTQNVRAAFAGEKIEKVEEGILPNGSQGVSFVHGQTTEIWFGYAGSLYQVMVEAGQENLISEVNASWKFE